MDMHVHLSNDFCLRYHGREDFYSLDNDRAGFSYPLKHPQKFPRFVDWTEHIERTANARPGTFYAELKGAFDGQHRQATATVHSGSAQLTSAGTGGFTWANPNCPDISELTDAYITRKITFSKLVSLASNAKGLGMGTLGVGAVLPYMGAGMTQAQRFAAQALAQQQAAAMQNAYGASMGASAVMAPPHKPTALKSEGVRAGEVIGWRAWRINSHDELVSATADTIWHASEPMSGNPASGYGIHAYKGPVGPALDGYAARTRSEWVVGEVALWGDIIEHEEGYRAEFARVHSLVTWADDVSKEQRARIADKYLRRVDFKLDDAA